MRHAIAGVFLGTLGAGCGAEVVPLPSTSPNLQAQLLSVEGEQRGRIHISVAKSGKALMKVEVHDLPPGAHGFHIHETGKCEAADGFESAGGHLSGGAAHGVMSDDGKHIGDLPNLYVSDAGSLRVEFFLDDLKIETGQAPLLDMDGASVIVHAVADDYESQPSGAAGARIACGVLERAPG